MHNCQQYYLFLSPDPQMAMAMAPHLVSTSSHADAHMKNSPRISETFYATKAKDSGYLGNVPRVGLRPVMGTGESIFLRHDKLLFSMWRQSSTVLFHGSELRTRFGHTLVGVTLYCPLLFVTVYSSLPCSLCSASATATFLY